MVMVVVVIVDVAYGAFTDDVVTWLGQLDVLVVVLVLVMVVLLVVVVVVLVRRRWWW